MHYFEDEATPQKKIQYLPDGAAFADSFTYDSAPTRRRRKAGPGCTSPLSGACRLPTAGNPPNFSLNVRLVYVRSLREVLKSTNPNGGF